MKSSSLAAIVVLCLAVQQSAAQGPARAPAPADGAVPKCNARLLGHAFFPAATYVDAPADAPRSLQTAGKFSDASDPGTANYRNETLNAFRPSATSTVDRRLWLPVNGQPVQGLSGIKTLRSAAGTPTGQYLVIADNGFGSKTNSPDALLSFYYMTPNFANNTVSIDRTVRLNDVNRVLPFRIVNENTDRRYLTGADLDTESIQPVGDLVYIGDEFGPFVIAAGATNGTVVKFFETRPTNGNKAGLKLTSPDHPTLQLPAGPTDPSVVFNVTRSRGYEGMALSADGRFLHPMLEGPLYSPATGFENYTVAGVPNTAVLPILSIEIATGNLTDTRLRYPLDIRTNSIGDFNFVSDKYALVIERDNGQGLPARACPAAAPAAAPRPAIAAPAPGAVTTASIDFSTCFVGQTAAFKRIYLVDISAPDANGVVPKLAYIDLLNIQDPNNVGVVGSSGGVFTFPFQTIENVDIVNNSTIIVANDNNYPYSIGRTPGVADNNEFILLDVGSLLSTGRC